MTIDECGRRGERRGRLGGHGCRRFHAMVVVSVRMCRADTTVLVLTVIGAVVLPVMLAMMRVAVGERRAGSGEAREDRQQDGDETDGGGAMHGQ